MKNVLIPAKNVIKSNETFPVPELVSKILRLIVDGKSLAIR